MNSSKVFAVLSLLSLAFVIGCAGGPSVEKGLQDYVDSAKKKQVHAEKRKAAAIEAAEDKAEELKKAKKELEKAKKETGGLEAAKKKVEDLKRLVADENEEMAAAEKAVKTAVRTAENAEKLAKTEGQKKRAKEKREEVEKKRVAVRERATAVKAAEKKLAAARAAMEKIEAAEASVARLEGEKAVADEVARKRTEETEEATAQVLTAELKKRKRVAEKLLDGESGSKPETSAKVEEKPKPESAKAEEEGKGEGEVKGEEEVKGEGEGKKEDEEPEKDKVEEPPKEEKVLTLREAVERWRAATQNIDRTRRELNDAQAREKGPREEIDKMREEMKAEKDRGKRVKMLSKINVEEKKSMERVQVFMAAYIDAGKELQAAYAAMDAAAKKEVGQIQFRFKILDPDYEGDVAIVMGSRNLGVMRAFFGRGEGRKKVVHDSPKDGEVSVWYIRLDENGMCDHVPRQVLWNMAINGPGTIRAYAKDGHVVFRAYPVR
jgi:hypothetical protein